MSLGALVVRHWLCLGARATAREGLCFEPSYETGRGVDSQPNLQCASRNSIIIIMTRMTKMM